MSSLIVDLDGILTNIYCSVESLRSAIIKKSTYYFFGNSLDG
tara:strand:+ start:328 stop:453 length:126 start_codon:yes stop_codon:yes gene_type:complete